MTRIDATWLTAPASRAVCAPLIDAGYQALFVGGCVRNALLGQPVSDLDIATDALPSEVMRLARAAGLRAVATGIEHGTVTLVSDKRPYEVTTFRRDVETDGRRAIVAFSRDIAEDAARRDFTMNSLYARPDGTVLDPLGGLGDLRAGRVRFVGDPATRIAEDALRILRFFRFFAWYGDRAAGPDAAGLAACAAGQDKLATLSRERVGSEMTKLLAAPDPAPALAAMAAHGILGRVLPGADPRQLAAVVERETDAGLPPRWQRRLAALGDATAWITPLRLSRREARVQHEIAAALATEASPAVTAYRHGAQTALDVAMISSARHAATPPASLKVDIDRGAAAVFPLRAADLALTGPALGAELKRLETVWIASDFTLDAAALRKLSSA